jgi:hypothetical protein
MLSPQKIFGNLFDDHRITSLRLSNFGEDCLTRFTTLAIEGQYATIISQITIALNNLRDELGDVDTRINTQKVKTHRVDQFLDNFKKSMSSVEGVVSFRSGKDSDVYLELYPNGVGEYSKANKTKMPILMHRMDDVVSRYGTQLTDEVTEILGTLKTGWETIRGDQEKQMTKVSDSRAERSVARYQLELALMGAVRAIGQEYVVDVEQSEKFFNFRLLYAATHHEGEEGEETETPQETDETPTPEPTPEPQPENVSN